MTDTENFEPRKTDRFLYGVFYAIILVQIPVAPLFLIKYYSLFVRFIFRLKESDMVFSSFGNIIFGLTGFFIWIPVAWFVFGFLFCILFEMKDTFKYYEKKSRENRSRTVSMYSLGSPKADIIFCVIAEIAALVFLVFSIFYNIRVTDEGIIHKKFFATKPELMRWENIESIVFDFELQGSKEKEAVPKLIVSSANARIDVWNGFGLGSPTAEELIAFTGTALCKNPNASLAVNFELTDENLFYIRKKVDGENRIRKVYNYIEENQRF